MFIAAFDLRHLRTLTALRDTGSLVEASERVFLTQSALSHQIKALETRMGCPLFVRKSKPVRFTPAGRRLLELADEVLPLVHSASRDIGLYARGKSGRLHLAIECHSCFEWLLPAIDRFRDQRPEVELDIASGFNFDPLPALARGDLDLVVTADPNDDATLAYAPLFGYEAQLAVAANHPLAAKEVITPEDLASETLIAYPVERSRMDIFKRFLDPAGVVPTGVRKAELTPMMVQLVATGRGVACLPNWALHEYVAHGYVIGKSLGEDGIWPNLYAAIRTTQRDVSFISHFIRTAKTTCFRNLVGVVPADEDVRAAGLSTGKVNWLGHQNGFHPISFSR